MSLIKLAGNASGTGTLTIQAPNTNTNYTLDLPAAAGTIQLSGNAISGTTGTFSGTISGGSTIGVGGATPANTGAGITFPATQSASSDANTLDDYEEGTFTVSLTPTTGSMTMDTGRDTLQYTKIGRMVHIQGYVRPSSVSSPTGAVSFTLPFTASAGTEFSGHGYGAVVPENLVSGNSNGFAVYTSPSSATATIYYTAGGGSSFQWLAVGEKFQGNTNVTFNFVYETAT